MSEIATAPDAPDAVAQPDAPVTPAATLSEASAALKSATSWAEVTGVEAPAAPEPADSAVEGATAPDPLAGFSVDTEGRLHRADGTFASAEEISTWNAGTEGTAPAEPTPEPVAAPEPIVVTLRGRDGKDVEIEVTDEQAAEVLRTNHREGLRASEYNKRMAQVQEKEAQFREFETLLETNPESVILQHLPIEKQVSLAVALIAQHWDTLAPHLVKFDTEPGTRIAEAANARVRMTEQDRAYEQRVQQTRYASQLETAARALVPEHIDEATATQFMQDASIELGNTIRARNGAMIPIDDVKTVLAKRLALYGFDKPAPTAASETPTPKRPVARPVTASQPPAPKTADPGASIRKTVTAQRIAAATPPQGAGAATVRQPLVPAGATIEEAGSKLRRAKSWAEVR